MMAANERSCRKTPTTFEMNVGTEHLRNVTDEADFQWLLTAAKDCSNPHHNEPQIPIESSTVD
jgi:hypothetical protein